MANNIWRPLPPLTDKDIQRFWAKVDRRGPTVCWLWTGAIHHGGYGVFQIKNKAFTATHVALQLSGRPRPPMPNHHALHWPCASRACCNPAHLRWGSPSDNMADMTEQDRSLTGERSPNAKLTEEAVRHIRSSDEEGRVLAAKYGVQPAAVSKVRKRRSWAHLP